MVGVNTTDYPESRGAPVSVGPCVRVIAGGSRGRVFPLDAPEVTVGRDDSVDLRLADTGVSRRHFKLLKTRDNLVMLLDLGSRNGTRVNGALAELVRLRDGDHVAIGPLAQLRFEYSGVRDPAPAPPSLTPRQIEVIRLIAAGRSTVEIADSLGIKERTITTHIDHIYQRLGVRCRASLTRFAFESGIVG